MPAWLPVLKAALPYIGNIVAAAIPAFTSRKGQEASAELVTRQIAELQEAVTGNAEAVKVLAAQVEKTITALAAGEAELAQRETILQQALDRCENTATLAQAQLTKLEGVAAAWQKRTDEFEQQCEQQWIGAWRRDLSVTAIALLALAAAIVALLR